MLYPSTSCEFEASSKLIPVTHRFTLSDLGMAKDGVVPNCLVIVRWLSQIFRRFGRPDFNPFFGVPSCMFLKMFKQANKNIRYTWKHNDEIYIARLRSWEGCHSYARSD